MHLTCQLHPPYNIATLHLCGTMCACNRLYHTHTQHEILPKFEAYKIVTVYSIHRCYCRSPLCPVRICPTWFCHPPAVGRTCFPVWSYASPSIKITFLHASVKVAVCQYHVVCAQRLKLPPLVSSTLFVLASAVLLFTPEAIPLH